MIGVRAWGVHIPRFRLPFGAIGGGGRKAAGGSGERSAISYDEDCVTMGVAAAGRCLAGIDRAEVDGLLFASTSYEYREKQAAAVVAKALDLRTDVRTADFSGSLRAGTTALRSALDAVAAGSARNVLVVVSDCRAAAPRSPLERTFGDAAAAFLVSRSSLAAAFDGAHALAEELIDVWRTDRDPWVKTWEDRFVVEHGFARVTLAACRQLAERLGCQPADFDRIALYAPDARSHASLVRALGRDVESRVQAPLFGRVGNAGAAFAPLLLAAALEASKPGDRLLVASYGDGADALAFTATDALLSAKPVRSVEWSLEQRAELESYDKFLSFRNLQVSAVDRRGGAGVSATVHYRERDQDISFHGHKCRACGQEQFPFQRVCFRCFGRDDFAAVRLAERFGRVAAYTFDHFAGSPDPPLIVATIAIDGGARAYLQMTDARPDEVRLDLPVEFVFRKIHEYGGTPNYFWKCTPIRDGGDA